MSDNLAMRFTGRSAWNMEKLSYGDLLFIDGSDVKSIDSQILKEAADEGTIFVFEGGRSDLEILCKAAGVPCLITAGCDDDMYFISKGVTEEDGILNQLVSAYRVSVLLPQTVERKEYTYVESRTVTSLNIPVL